MLVFKKLFTFFKRTVTLLARPLSKPKQMFIHIFFLCDKLASMLEFVGGAGFSRSGKCYKTYFCLFYI
jgi:hypothetical protein